MSAPPTAGPHLFAVRVFYEDTDMAGIVYHANYLRFVERARSDWVAGLGIDQRAMRAEGRAFAVRRIAAEFLAPAGLDDRLEVATQLTEAGRARLVLRQVVRRGAVPLFAADVTLVALDLARGRPVRLPAPLLALRGG